MSKKIEPIRSVKGTRDLLPRETALWQRVEDEARRVFAAYNFREIRTPILEQTALFARSVGADTDIVSKEMYTFEDHQFGDLEKLKERIKTSKTEIVIPSYPGSSEYVAVSNLDIFQADVDEFIRSVQRPLELGDIPKTPANLDAIRALTEEREKLRQQVNRGLPALQAIIPDTAVRIQRLIGQFELGVVLTLRPEATASVVRAYNEHSMANEGGIHKLYYIGPMFRRERPQKGRYRQFYQIGAEVLGSDHPTIDAEFLEMLALLLARVGITEYQLLLNSVGCPNCRPKFVETLRHALAQVKDKMCVDCQRRAETNPLRVLDCKVEADQPIIEKLPHIIDHLCPDCRAHFDHVTRELGERGVAYQITPRLVRGLDYYTRTTFEMTSSVLGAQNAFLGGGRYDGLSEMIGGPPTPGFGVAIGEDRLLLMVEKAGKLKPDDGLDVFVVWMGDAAAQPAARLVKTLRHEGLRVDSIYEAAKLKKSLGQASKLGARFAVIIGEGELASGRYQVKDMVAAMQEEIEATRISTYLKKRLGRGRS